MAKTKSVKKSAPRWKPHTPDPITVEGEEASVNRCLSPLSYGPLTMTVRERMALEFTKMDVSSHGLAGNKDARIRLAHRATAMADALLAELAKPRKK